MKFKSGRNSEIIIKKINEIRVFSDETVSTKVESGVNWVQILVEAIEKPKDLDDASFSRAIRAAVHSPNLKRDFGGSDFFKEVHQKIAIERERIKHKFYFYFCLTGITNSTRMVVKKFDAQATFSPSKKSSKYKSIISARNYLRKKTSIPIGIICFQSLCKMKV